MSNHTGDEAFCLYTPSRPSMPTCYRCDHDDRNTEHHTIRFSDDQTTKRKALCAVCVRRLRQADNAVRSIT